MNQEVHMTRTRQRHSYNNNIVAMNVNTTGLSPYEDKRYVLSNGQF